MAKAKSNEKFVKTALTVNSNASGVNAVVYTGISAGKKISQTMNEAKREIKICSPFISPTLLTKLAERAKNDKDLKILLITSFGENTEAKIRKALVECSKHIKIVVYDYLSLNDKPSKEELANRLQMHAKFWLLDKKILYITSSNFTFGGMKNNFETRIRIEKGENGSANDHLVGLYRQLFDNLEKNIGNFKLWNIEDFKTTD